VSPQQQEIRTGEQMAAVGKEPTTAHDVVFASYNQERVLRIEPWFATKKNNLKHLRHGKP
jgi:hypothetical protein